MDNTISSSPLSEKQPVNRNVSLQPKNLKKT